MEKKLIVVKAGTTSLTGPTGDVDREKISHIVSQLADLRDAGHSVMLVSSGAIAAGFRALGYSARPSDLAGKQAAAAVGQGLLMEEYTRFFAARGYVTAQLLLTREDFTDHRRYKNAFSAVEVLLARGAVPVVNENDTVSIDEIKVGDNDTLSAQVAAMVHADLLVILTDVGGLYTADPSKDPTARLIPVVDNVDDVIDAAGDSGSSNGTGGMITKLRGAKLATRAGVPVFICSSSVDDQIIKAISGEGEGTLFKADDVLRTRTQWLAFYAPSCGEIYVDDGAARAVAGGKSSLLRAGVTEVKGDFTAGDTVEVLSSSGEKLGRGIASADADDIRNNSGPGASGIAIHRDGLFVIGPGKER